MNNEDVLLTIAIPTFNRHKLLKSQLCDIHKIINNNKFSSNVELLVSDNCSNDKTDDVVRNHSLLDKKYMFTTTKNNSNVGGDENFMIACLKSSGRFVWTLSDDDKLEDGAIEYVFTALSNNLNIGCGMVNYFITKKKDITAIPNPLGSEGYVVANNFDSFIREVLVRFGNASSCIYRRSLLSEYAMKKSVGSAYPHLWWMADLASSYPSLVIRRPIYTFIHPGVAETRINSSKRETSKKENYPFDFYLYAHLSVLKFNLYINKFLSSKKTKIKLYRLSLDENINQIIFHKITVEKYDITAIAAALKVMIRRFYFSPTFWIVHIPILILPSSVAKFIEPYRWKYLEFRSSILTYVKNFYNAPWKIWQ